MTNSTNSVPAEQHNSNMKEGSSTSGRQPLSESTHHCVTKPSNETPSQTGFTHRNAEPATYMAHDSHGAPSSLLNMNDMRAMLPVHTYTYDQYHMHQQFVPTAHPHGVLYPLHPLQPYPGTHPNPNPASYHHQFTQAYSPYVQTQHQNTPHSHNSGYQLLNAASPVHFGFQVSSQAVGHGYNYHRHHQGPRQTSTLAHDQDRILVPAHVGMHSPPAMQKPATTTQPLPGARSQALNSDYDVSKTIVDGSTPMRSAPIHSSSTDSTLFHPNHTPPSLAPRGPSRKPKQSGHALWVGNLPPGATIVDLKDHFSRDATKDVESVFLISKSNCAFINYKTEAACSTALERFNDSRFHGVRLVCRLRRGPMTPASNLDPFGPSTLVQDGDRRTAPDTGEGPKAHSGTKGTTGSESSSWVPHRYFVVKSLTVEDLEVSRRSGIWATQSHNEDCLNQAFESANNVYLVFSANKSGEYYGYARMISPIQEDDSLTMAMPPRSTHVHAESPILDMTPTPATGTAPTGRIINDAARGTIFWEADSSSDEEDAKSERSAGEGVEETTEPGFQSIGNPFRIQWLSTERVPFHRTRGLRNPWNANREIKIARDGTEIEPSVGARLIQLFHSPGAG